MVDVGSQISHQGFLFIYIYIKKLENFFPKILETFVNFFTLVKTKFSKIFPFFFFSRKTISEPKLAIIELVPTCWAKLPDWSKI